MFLPKTRKQWVGFALITLVWLWFFSGAIPGRGHRYVYAGPHGIAKFTFVTAAGIAWCWWLFPPPIIRELRYATAPIRIEFGANSFETRDGTYQIAALTSMRLTELESLPGRYGVEFTGSAVPHATMIGWPGLPSEMAKAVMDAVATRAGVVPPAKC